MKSQFKKEKQDIQEIINEIDGIMFDSSVDLHFYRGQEGKSFIGGLIGFVCGAPTGMLAGIGIDAMLQNTNNQFSSIVGMYICGAIGASIGSVVGHFSDKNSEHLRSYESAYLSLNRKQQLQVLKLSEKLIKYYQETLKSNKNKRYLKKFLYLNNSNTMFNQFENNHPQFKLLFNEEIDDIHSRGKLTPFEKYKEWVSIGYCPGLELNGWDCSKYDKCRDCRVDCAVKFDEWEPTILKNDNMIDETEISDSQKKKIINKR